MTAYCCATRHAQVSVSFHRAVEETEDITILEEKKGEKSKGDDDDYEYMSSFNPLYLSIILIGVGGLLVAGLGIRDVCTDAKTDKIITLNEAPFRVVTKQDLVDSYRDVTQNSHAAIRNNWDGEAVVPSLPDSMYNSMPSSPEKSKVAWIPSE